MKDFNKSTFAGVEQKGSGFQGMDQKQNVIKILSNSFLVEKPADFGIDPFHRYKPIAFPQFKTLEDQSSIWN